MLKHLKVHPELSQERSLSSAGMSFLKSVISEVDDFLQLPPKRKEKLVVTGTMLHALHVTGTP